MQLVGLFLFTRGLATFSGMNRNVSLLFPMEQVFEDFIGDSFRRHQLRYTVVSQGPRRAMTSTGSEDAFSTMPDLALRKGKDVRLVLDTKWKRVDASSDDPKHGIQQADVYQLYAYARRYDCAAVALVYPRSESFRSSLRYRFFDGVRLVAIPFDATEPQSSVTRAIEELEKSVEKSAL